MQLNRKITESSSSTTTSTTGDADAVPRAHHQKKLAKETADDAHRFGKNATEHTRARVIAGKIVRFALLQSLTTESIL